jgi:hypothetical protein
VGKTYDILGEGQRRAGRGTDVVIAFMEDYGRALTRQMAQGLETVPRRTMRYREATFTEMDLDAVLARHPKVAQQAQGRPRQCRPEPAGRTGRAEQFRTFRTCARLDGDSKDDEDGEEVVLQGTRITLCLLARRIGQLAEQIQGLEGRLARLVDATPRSCFPWWVSVRTRPSLC